MFSTRDVGVVLNPARRFNRMMQPFCFGSPIKILTLTFIYFMSWLVAVIGGPAVWAGAGLVSLGIILVSLPVLFSIPVVLILCNMRDAYHDGTLTHTNQNTYLIELVNAYNAMGESDRKRFKSVMNQVYARLNENSKFQKEIQLFECYENAVVKQAVDVDRLLDEALEEKRMRDSAMHAGQKIIDEINKGVL